MYIKNITSDKSNIVNTVIQNFVSVNGILSLSEIVLCFFFLLLVCLCLWYLRGEYSPPSSLTGRSRQVWPLSLFYHSCSQWQGIYFIVWIWQIVHNDKSYIYIYINMKNIIFDLIFLISSGMICDRYMFLFSISVNLVGKTHSFAIPHFK